MNEDPSAPNSISDPADRRLAEQYEAYPYPQRDPRKEATRLLIGSPSHLREIDHFVFAARPRSRPLRALIAGGGTGDALVALATQMARDGRPGRIAYLDRSRVAAAIARGRMQTRGLDNIEWLDGSLLDLPGMGLAPFDYIDCCGVLHHLPDPAAGLAALVAVLAPGGGMGLMVYAPHGRTGVYMVQDALRLLAPHSEPAAVRLDVARRVLKHLPDGAWLRQNRAVTDHLAGGDAGLFDLLLNPRDRAFTIDALLALLAGAGLQATCLLEPLRYDPDAYLPDPKLRARTVPLDATARAALAEALSGTMSTHVVYCVRAGDPAPLPDFSAAASVPVVREGTGEALAAAIRPDGTLPFTCEALTTAIALPASAPALLRLVDGVRSVSDIAAAMAARGTADATFRRAWAETSAKLQAANRLLLMPPP